MATNMDNTATTDDILEHTITLDPPRKKEIRDQSDIVDGCADDCLDDQILLLEHIGNVPWTTLPANVQNVLSVKFLGSEHRCLKVDSAVKSLRALPAPTPNRPQAASASAYVTPLSLVLETTNQQTQSPGTADRGSVKRKAAPTLSDAIGSLPANFKKPRLSGPEDDYVPSDDDEPADLVDAEVVAAATAECLAQAVKDEDFIRVGPQPMKPQVFVRSAPAEKATDIVGKAVDRLHKLKDSRFPSADAGRLQLAATKLVRELESLMIESKAGWVKLLCDYTGLPTSWAPGPRSPSIESTYPVVQFKGHYGYHAPPNACLIMSFINWTKRQHPSIALPLVSVWLKAYQETNFDARQRQCAWAFNALLNTTIITRSFYAIGTHESKFKRWDNLEVSQRRAILEMQRTGERRHEVEDMLQTAKVKFLWTPTSAHPFTSLAYHGSAIYRNLKRIAESKGVTASEFEYYCTILSPGPFRQRVFYPFHIFSRPQAESVRWDWPMLHQVCRQMLHTMRTACNRYAEKAGHGEAHVEEVRLIYWIGAWVCDQINSLKAQMSNKEEIAFSLMLDRWGLPIVPWVSHILRVSLCKKQDHGIAMVFGIADVPDFDPVQHIDLDLATVTLDTGYTNMAMSNYDTGSWDSLRSILAQIPLHHPFWKVNLSLGDEVWAGGWDRSVEPQAPTPEFLANLLSIEAWVDEQPRDPFACAYCARTFNGAGQLVEHSRRCSRGIQDEQEAPNLDSADQDYWDFRCDECGKTFSALEALVRHKKLHLGIKPHKCGKCTSAFATAEQLRVHERTHTDERPFKCDKCTSAFKTSHALRDHKLTHTGEKPYKCADYPYEDAYGREAIQMRQVHEFIQDYPGPPRSHKDAYG
ncbi:hypothetical protein ACHAPQ_011144 [Fusarium lateritium]